VLDLRKSNADLRKEFDDFKKRIEASKPKEPEKAGAM